MNIKEKYELVVGLEVHAQLRTSTKAYSKDFNIYGAMPNTQLSAISLGFPGILPKVNKKVVDYAIKIGLSCGSEIAAWQQYARKNYFYPDLPKGYQITQDKTPICTGGFLTIKDEKGHLKSIRLERIHMEEDSGKSIHDLDPHYTLIDLNRAGVPLIEIVSAPDIKTPQEAHNYLSEMRKLLRYLEICDGNMEEGSMRCDVNISVKKKGEKELRQRVEVKNLNSFRNVVRAIEFEFDRQVEVYENQGHIAQETRGFNAVKGETYIQRTKEGAADYRYFPEPDLPVLTISADYIENIRINLPILPAQLYQTYTKTYGLSDYDATVLTENKQIAHYYNQMLNFIPNYKMVANWLTGSVKEYLNKTATSIESFPISASQMGKMIGLIHEGQITHHIADKFLFPALLKEPHVDPFLLAQKNQWLNTDEAIDLNTIISNVIQEYPQKVAEYLSGNEKLLPLFIGAVMKATKGKANPQLVNELILAALKK